MDLKLVPNYAGCVQFICEKLLLVSTKVWHLNITSYQIKNKITPFWKR